MNFSSIVNQLNNCVSRGNGKGKNVYFYHGSLPSVLPSLSFKLAPYGKIAILYSESSYQQFGIELGNQLKKVFNSVTHVILPDLFTDNVENYSHLFNLAEDIRLIVATDKKFFGASKYFANQRGIPCVLYLCSLNCYGFLSQKLTVQNGDKQDIVNATANQHVIIDYESAIKRTNFADAYAFVVSHSLALVDYKINTEIFGIKPDNKSLIFAKKIITSTFDLPLQEKTRSQLIICKNLLCLEIFNFLHSDKIYKSFSCYYSSKVYSQHVQMGKLLLLSAIPTAKIYQIYFTNKYDKLLDIPNYFARADFLSEKLNIKREKTLKELIFQSEQLQEKSKQIANLSNRILEEVKWFLSMSNCALNAYSKFGGDLTIDQKKRANAIKHSGDVCFNGMSLVRESGILEQI